MTEGKPYSPSETGDRVIGETGDVLQTEDGWNLEDHENDDGPTIQHVPCELYICDLNRKYPMCRGCGTVIPPSMISGFTMLNWNKAGDDEYFVQAGDNEVEDFVYNGHLRKELEYLDKRRDLQYNITEEMLNKAMKDLTGEKP